MLGIIGGLSSSRKWELSPFIDLTESSSEHVRPDVVLMKHFGHDPLHPLLTASNASLDPTGGICSDRVTVLISLQGFRWSVNHDPTACGMVFERLAVRNPSDYDL